MLFFIVNKALMKNGTKHILLTLGMVTVVFSALAILNEDATLDLNSKRGLFGWLDN
jgi:hypothetical protein